MILFDYHENYDWLIEYFEPSEGRWILTTNGKEVTRWKVRNYRGT